MAKQDTSTASGAVGIAHRILSVARAETMSGGSGTEGKRARKGKREGSPGKGQSPPFGTGIVFFSKTYGQNTPTTGEGEATAADLLKK